MLGILEKMCGEQMSPCLLLTSISFVETKCDEYQSFWISVRNSLIALRIIALMVLSDLESKHYMHYAELIAYANDLLMGEDLLAVGEALSDLTRDIFTRKYVRERKLIQSVSFPELSV